MSLSGRSPHAPSRRAPRRPSVASVVSRSRQLSVCVRCAPLSAGERTALDTSTPNVLKFAAGGKDLVFGTEGLSFFGPQSTVEELYNRSVRDFVPSMVTGINGSIFTFGAHNTGKTRTLIGTQAAPGLLGLAVYDLFKAITKTPGLVVTAQYFDLRNETIHDLLSPGPEGDIELREHPATGLTIFGLTRIRLENPEDVWKVLERGNSRKDNSHMMFQLTLHHTLSSSKRTTKLSFFDLAGFSKADIEMDKGLRAVRNVIKALTSSPGLYIPFRDSKLTRILKDSFVGKTNTVLVASIGVAESQFDETQDTLRLVQRARGLLLDSGQSDSSFAFPFREHDGTLTLLRAELQDWKPLEYLDLKLEEQSQPGLLAHRGSTRSPSRADSQRSSPATLPRNFHAPSHAAPTRPNSNSVVSSPAKPPPPHLPVSPSLSSSSSLSALPLSISSLLSTTTSTTPVLPPAAVVVPDDDDSASSKRTCSFNVSSSSSSSGSGGNSGNGGGCHSQSCCCGSGGSSTRSPSPGFFRDPRNRSVLEQHLSTKLTSRIAINFQERIQVHRALMELSNLRKYNIRLMAQSHGASRTRVGSVFDRSTTITTPQQADAVIRQNEKIKEQLQVELKRLEKEAQTLLAQATETSHLKAERHQLVKQTLERCSLELQNTEYELMLSSLGRTLADKQRELELKDEELEKREYELEQKENEIKLLRSQLPDRGGEVAGSAVNSEPSLTSSQSALDFYPPPPPITPPSASDKDKDPPPFSTTRVRSLSHSPVRHSPVQHRRTLDIPRGVESSETRTSISRSSINDEDDIGRPRRAQRSIDNDKSSVGFDDLQPEDFLKDGMVAPWYTDHEGWLAKKSTAKLLGFGAKWQKRWFVLKLDQLCLSYFKSEMDVIPLGIIPLHNCLFVQALGPRKFSLCLENRVYELKAEDNQRCNEWLGHLDMCIRDFLTSPRRGGAIATAISQAALTMEARELMFGRSMEQKRRATPPFPQHLKSLLPSLKTSDMVCSCLQSHFFRLCFPVASLTDSAYLMKLNKIWPSDQAVLSTLLNVLVDHSFELPSLSISSPPEPFVPNSTASKLLNEIKEIQIPPSLSSDPTNLRERIYAWVRHPTFFRAITDECLHLEPLAVTLVWTISQFQAHAFDDSPLLVDAERERPSEPSQSEKPRSKLGALFASNKAKLLDLTQMATQNNGSGSVEGTPRSGESRDLVDIIEAHFAHVFDPYVRSNSTPTLNTPTSSARENTFEAKFRESVNPKNSTTVPYFRRRPSKILSEETDLLKKVNHWKWKYIDDCPCCRQGQNDFHERILKVSGGAKFTQKVCDSLFTLLTTSIAFWAGAPGLSAFNKPILNLGVVRTLLACALDSDPHMRAYTLRELNGLLMPNHANVDAILQISQWQSLLLPLLKDITPELLQKSRIWEKVFNYVLAAFATIHFHAFLFHSRLGFPSVILESFSYVDDLGVSEVRIAFTRGLLATLVTKLAAAYASKRFETAQTWDLILFVLYMVKYFIFCMPVAHERDDTGLLPGMPGLHDINMLREDMALVEKTLQLLRVLKIWSPVDVGGLLDLPNTEKAKLAEFVEKHQRVDLSHPVFKPNAADLQSVTQNAAPTQQKCLKVVYDQMQFFKDSLSFLAMVRAKNLVPQIPESQFQSLVHEFVTRKARERLGVFHLATMYDFSR